MPLFPALREAEAGRSEFEASQVYIASYRPVRATQHDSVSKGVRVKFFLMYLYF